MEFDGPRRCLPQHSAWGNYYYSDRNSALALTHATRTNPRGYPMGGPVGGMHSRTHMGREESLMDTGSSRKRIAVACARCRRRKIRCSGDPGNGTGCINCRQAGVDPAQCLFHRVGSDNVHKVMDSIHMTNGYNVTSLYPGNDYNTPYSRQQYPQLDTKPSYPSAWTEPYSEDTSPIENYGINQAAAYLSNPLSNPASMSSASMYPPSYRWTSPNPKPLQHGTNSCFNQNSSFPTHGLPYEVSSSRLNTSSKALSPLNMGSMQMALPERPHPRQLQHSDASVPRRQLPIPQPSPAQTSRNVVDQLQDARLRSAQASTIDSRASFAKPVLSWNVDVENQINIAGATSIDTTPHTNTPGQGTGNADGVMSYVPTTTSMTGDTSAASTSSQFQLNFSTSGLLDGLNVSAPTPTYSNFREVRTPPSSSAQMPHQNSQSNLYSFNSDYSSKRNSLGAESSNDCTLVSGHQYQPLNHSQSQRSPGGHNLRREPYQSRTFPLQRTPML